ncbi:MAG: adenylyltransferase/cytidyltransferase family protein [Candidatus Kerfeldbacteria bacterium]
MTGQEKKTVLAFGTFDRLHEGHRFFLRSAREHGERLVVVVARDNNVEQIKGRLPREDEQTRRQKVQECEGVDEAQLGKEQWEAHLDVLAEVKPDVICLGYDQKAVLPDGPWKVIRIDAFEPERYKSSLME